MGIDLKLAFSMFKVGCMFSVKDTVPFVLPPRVVNRFLCAGCNCCYIGETTAAPRYNEPHYNEDPVITNNI